MNKNGEFSETLAQAYFRTRTMRGDCFIDNGVVVAVYGPLDKQMRIIWAQYHTMLGTVDITYDEMVAGLDKMKAHTKLSPEIVDGDLAFQTVYLSHTFVSSFLRTVRFMSLMYGMSYIGDNSVIRIYGAKCHVEKVAMHAFASIARFKIVTYGLDKSRWFDFINVDGNKKTVFGYMLNPPMYGSIYNLQDRTICTDNYRLRLSDESLMVLDADKYGIFKQMPLIINTSAIHQPRVLYSGLAKKRKWVLKENEFSEYREKLNKDTNKYYHRIIFREMMSSRTVVDRVGLTKYRYRLERDSRLIQAKVCNDMFFRSVYSHNPALYCGCWAYSRLSVHQWINILDPITLRRIAIMISKLSLKASGVVSYQDAAAYSLVDHTKYDYLKDSSPDRISVMLEV